MHRVERPSQDLEDADGRRQVVDEVDPVERRIEHLVDPPPGRRCSRTRDCVVMLEVPAAAGRQVVDDDDLVAVLHVPVDEMRTDEARHRR